MRYGLCAPPSAQLKLEDMLASHLAKVSCCGERVFWGATGESGRREWSS